MVQRVLDGLDPEDEAKEPAAEAYTLALELFNAKGTHHRLKSSSAALLLATTSRMAEVCKVIAKDVEGEGEDWSESASWLAVR